jgi:hypothetical protein
MTDLRTAAQQALEALEELNGWQSLAPPLASQAGRQAAINLRAALEQPEQTNPWRDAVDHELSTLHMVASDDPRESIRRLINWHCAVQIDPLVSSAAQELIERGRREALEQPEQTCNCRWVGDVQTQQCTLHEAHVDAIHEWAERAKAAEAKLAALEQPEQEPVAWLESPYGSIRMNTTMRFQFPPQSLKWKIPLYTHPPRREWRGLTEEDIYPLYSEPSSDAEMVEFARAIEAALRSKNHE